MSKLRVAEIPEIGQIRFTEQDGQKYYVGKDILKAVEVLPETDNVRKTLEEYCVDVRTINRNGYFVCIPSDDVYQLLVRLNLISVDKFKKMFAFISKEHEPEKLKLVSTDVLAKKINASPGTIVNSTFKLQATEPDFGEIFYLDWVKAGRNWRTCYLNESQVELLANHGYIHKLDYSSHFTALNREDLKIRKAPVINQEVIKVEILNDHWVNNIPGMEKVRSFFKNNARWFVGEDIAKALGYTNTQEPLRLYCDRALSHRLQINDGFQNNLTIQISDVCKLILKSDLPSAETPKIFLQELISLLSKTIDEKLEPETAKEPEPESAKEPEPESAKELEPESAKELEPETAKELEPESAKEPEPESAKESEPESVKELEPESAKELEPESAKELEPESAKELEPESAKEPEPESAKEPEPESAKESEPESAKESEPESAKELEPETAKELEPESVQVIEPEIANQNESWVNRVPGLEGVRSFLNNNRRWFIGGDVTKALGYASVQKVLKQHCKCVKLFPVKTNGGTQKVLTIPGGEVYRLITRSDLLSTEPAKEYFYNLLWSLTEKPNEKQEATKPESVQEPEVANDSWGIDALGTEKMRFEILLESVENNLNKTMRDFGILNAFYWFSLVLLLAFIISKVF